ncbi:hypothetical protein IHV77_11105 [Rodentibacter haemolyticus]|uniref:Pycsar effector protein domain-containing protein n=2 Tax=Rodentibacter haemolyticus TaxID=2778911 RepID=A0ABX6V012_9PAST|nr:hypothetical protein IHV77_11105 [Rodentibacter haemolyticus]
MLLNKIDKLESILERNISFIVNCDTKVSFWLSTLGVIFTILFTVRIPTLDYVRQNFSDLQSICGCFTLVLIIFICSLISCVIGIYFLIQVLIARIECNGYSNSKIFFGHIVQYSDYRNYLNVLKSTTLDEYKEDLVSQIYINAVICTEKFKNYNKGAKFCIYSLPFLIWSWSYIFQK